MGTFGKVLAVLNVLAAIGFIGLAITDYGRRRAWEFVLQQQDFTVNGLAVDDKEQDVEGQSLKDLAGKRMQQQLGVSVATQADEVNSRHGAFTSAIQGADPETRRKLLLPLARNVVEHYEIATAKTADLANDAPLFTKITGPEGPVESAFNAATKASAYDVRRYAIAHFLFNTSVEPGDYQRTLAVVGLASYARALDAQTVHLQSMVPQIGRDIENDRSAFVSNHRALIEQIVQLERRLRGLQEALAKHEEELNQHRALLAARKQDALDLNARIKETTTAAEKALALQSTLEKELFAADAEAARTKEANERLDKEIKTKELGR